MRDAIYRGYRVDNGEAIIGDILIVSGNTFIRPFGHTALGYWVKQMPPVVRCIGMDDKGKPKLPNPYYTIQLLLAQSK